MVLIFTSLYLTKDLHFSIAEAGIVMSFYGGGSILGSYAGGWLTDRRNYFDIMIFSLISSGLILLLMLIAASELFIIGIIFFYSFTADMFRPANAAAIAAFTIPENRTRSVSLVRLAINLGFSIGPAIGGFIALYFGYHLLFLLDALTSFGAATMLFYYLPKQVVEKNRHENAVLKDSSTSAYRDYRYLSFILLVALYGICFFQLFASIPQYYHIVCHYQEDTIGLLLALNGLIVVLIEMPLIASLQKSKNIFSFIIVGVLCIPIALGVLQFGPCLMIAALMYTVMITFSEIFSMPFMMNFSLSRARRERQGQYSALYSISFGIANVAAPSLGLGIASRYGFNTMFDFFIALSIAVAIGFGFLRRKTSRDPV